MPARARSCCDKSISSVAKTCLKSFGLFHRNLSLHAAGKDPFELSLLMCRCPCQAHKRKRPGSRGAPAINRPEHQAATLVCLTSKSLPELAIGIARGFIASGISRTRSTCRSPFSRLAPLTST
jgi:hypothetical protein